MKKHTLSLAGLLIVALLASSCSKREGVIYKKNKIDNIYAVENRYFDNQLFNSIENYLEEDWHWDGDELYRIDYRSDHPYSENFFYGSHRRLERTTVPAYDIRSEFFYDGRQLDHIDIFRNDNPYMTLTLLHDDDRLYEIDCLYHQTTADTASVALLPHTCPLAFLLGRQMAAQLEADNRTRLRDMQMRGAKSNTIRYLLTWSDDNVTAIDCIDDNGTRRIALTYDDKINPYRQLFGYRELTDPLFGFEMLSENNITSIRMPYLFNQNQLFTYRYEYEDDCPSKRTLTYSYPAVNNTFDSVMFKYEKIETFQYLQ